MRVSRFSAVVVVLSLVASLLVAVPPAPAVAAEGFDPGEVERFDPIEPPTAEELAEADPEEAVEPERVEEVAELSPEGATTWLLDDGSFQTEVIASVDSAHDGTEMGLLDDGEASPGAPNNVGCIRTGGQPGAGGNPGQCAAAGRVGADFFAGVQRTLLSFTTRQAVPDTAHIRRADLNLQITSTSALPDEVWAHALTEGWGQTATWTHRTSNGAEWQTPGGSFSTDPVAKVVPGQRSGGDLFDLTGIVQEWVRTSEPDYGVLLKTPSEDTLGGRHLTYDVTSAGADGPTLTIVWTPPQAGRHGGTAETFELAGAGQLSVDTVSGQATWQAEDVTVAGTAGFDFSVVRSITSSLAFNDSFGAIGNQLRYVSEHTATFVHPVDGHQVTFTRSGRDEWRPLQRIDADFVSDDPRSATSTLTMHGTDETFTFTQGRLTRVEDRNGNAVTFEWTLQLPRRMTRVVDTQGRAFTIGYTLLSRTSVQDPAGRVHTYAHTGSPATNGQFSYTNPAGETSTAVWDMLSSVPPGGGTVSQRAVFTNDAGQQMTVYYAVIGGQRRVVSVELDGTGSQPDRWEFAYDPAGHTTTVTDARGNDTTYDYDRAGYLTRTVDANGNEQASAYDSQGNVIAATSARGMQTTSTYDEGNRLTSQTMPTGGESTLAYDNDDHPYQATGYTKPQGTSVAYDYDEAGNLSSVTAEDSQYSYDYNDDGTINEAADGNDNTTSYGYDAFGNMTVMSPPGPVGDTTTSYDSLSRPTAVVDGNGDQTTYTWDVLDRIASVSYADGQTITYTYDNLGNQTALTDPTGTTTYTYDERNRLASETRPGNITTTYTWDPVGNLLQTTDTTGTVNYDYNVVNLLDTLTDRDGQDIDFAYDADNQRTRTTYPNGVEQEQVYDDSGRLDRITGWRGSTELTNFDYSYQDDGEDTGLRQSVATHDGEAISYGYDDQDRLTSVVIDQIDGPRLESWDYAYDDASNRTQQRHTVGTSLGPAINYSYNAANQMVDAGGVTFTYDDAGQLTGSSEGLAIGYDAGRRTTSITPPDATGPIEADYTGATQNARTSFGATAFTNTMLGVSDQTRGELVTRFTRDHEGTLTSLHHPTDGAHYYLFDGLGSVVAVTDADGEVVNRYTYDAYGDLRDHDEAVENPWRYTGEYHDTATGMYKIGERYYQPEHGRWTQPDPLHSRINPADPGETNPYTYVGCDPINHTDPTGLLSFNCTAALTLAVAAGILATASVIGAPYTLPGVLKILAEGAIIGGGVVLGCADELGVELPQW